MRLLILEFTNLEDFIDHLARTHCAETRLDIGYEQGEKGDHGIRGVTFLVVATARLDDHIACWAQPAYRTTNYDLEYFDKARPEDEQARSKIWEAHRKIRDELEGRGLQVQPGKWRIDQPEYLSSSGRVEFSY